MRTWRPQEPEFRLAHTHWSVVAVIVAGADPKAGGDAIGVRSNEMAFAPLS